MAKVHILNVTVHNNPAPFFTPLQFEIHFECLEDLQDDLEFKIIYVGSAETYEFDQVLDQIVVDAVPQGQFKFMFQADPPDTAKIPADDAVGVTVVLITAAYREQEFVRVGYYVTNEYEDPELREIPPTEPQFPKLIRTIAANEPRVTKFKINWDSQKNGMASETTANTASVTAANEIPVEINKENINNSNSSSAMKPIEFLMNPLSGNNSSNENVKLNENSNFNNLNVNPTEESGDSIMIVQ